MNQVLPTIQPSPELCPRIQSAIHRKVRQNAMIRLLLNLSGGLMSLIGMIETIRYIATTSTQSGFWQYLSLALSDGVQLLGSWRQFVLLLAETAPIFGVVLFLITMLATIATILRSVEQASRLMKNQRLLA